MKQSVTILLLTMIIPLWMNAQPDRSNEERLRALRVAYITEKVGLTADEAAEFWPVHNEMNAEMERIRSARMTMIDAHRSGLESIDENELRNNMQLMFELEEDELAIKKKYHERYLRILSVEQVARLYLAEEQFKRELIRRVGRNRDPNAIRERSMRRGPSMQ